ncbi:MAG TPA: beta-L-arabinofuranosidase domain-containing protein [Polyangiaceae bacterium]
MNPSSSIVDTRQSPHARWRSLPLGAIRLRGGFWQLRLEMNRRVSLGHGYRMLEEHGNFENLRLAAAGKHSGFRGPVFMDSDVYKWAEAASLELANGHDSELAERLDRTCALIASAQMSDGYLNSYFQVAEPGQRWTNLQHQHELYCAGHLFQAAVAHRRTTGNDRLLSVAVRFADHIDATFGPDKRAGTCGHPEVEMALVELYRLTGTSRYLDLARHFIDERGKKRFGGWPHDTVYYQDHVPVRDATTVAGHAVRQLYLMSGATDLYLESGDRALFDAMMRQYTDLVVGKLYITGGAGSRHEGESFGGPYELPNDRAYCETCAAIALAQWAWRMLLATGRGAFADLTERALFNNVLAGVSLDGTRYFYVNPLLSRGGVERPEWHGCACCPPNVMRTLSSITHLFASEDQRGIQLHQYASADVRAADGRFELRMDTRYPWDGRVVVDVLAAEGEERSISLRIPEWASAARFSINGAPQSPSIADGYAVVTRRWKPGDRLEMLLPLEPRFTVAHPHSDATQTSVALERGPLVYCFEQADHAGSILDAVVDARAPLGETRDEALLGGVTVIDAEGEMHTDESWNGRLYRPLPAEPATRERASLRAVPYYAWANRSAGPMRVWMPMGSER